MVVVVSDVSGEGGRDDEKEGSKIFHMDATLVFRERVELIYFPHIFLPVGDNNNRCPG